MHYATYCKYNKHTCQICLNEIKHYHTIAYAYMTKIMVFNKSFSPLFSFNGETLDIVEEYTYLGLLIHKSGSFKKAIKELSLKSKRAFFCLKSMLKESSVPPKLFIKLFDLLVKPILLYCSEVWGGFAVKTSTSDAIYEKLMNNDKTPYEIINIKLCKQSLRLPLRVSNLAARAELGRLPLRHNIIVAQLKYFARAKLINNSELLAQAMISQGKLLKNSYNTFTYTQLCENLLNELGLQHICSPNRPIKIDTYMKQCGGLVKEKSIACFQDLFLRKINLEIEQDTKLSLYGILKRNYKYEKYLDMTCENISEFTKFRMSTHWLPIERGRYENPKIPREERLCYFCKSEVGTEYHVLMKCSEPILRNLRTEHIEKITEAVPCVRGWPHESLFRYMMLGIDISITPIAITWITQCNSLNKNKLKNC